MEDSVRQRIKEVLKYKNTSMTAFANGDASLAAELEIPKETISAALGHEIGSRITSIYIDYDQRKVDAANRRLIDHIKNGMPHGTPNPETN